MSPRARRFACLATAGLALAMWPGPVAAQQSLWFAGGSDNCGGAPCTAIYRYDCCSLVPRYVLPGAYGEIVRIAVDANETWYALVRTPAGSPALVRDALPVALLPGAPVDVAAADDGTVYVATQVRSPVMQPGTVHAWENGVLTHVFTQPGPPTVELLALSIDVDESLVTVAGSTAPPDYDFFLDGVWYDGYGLYELTSFEIGPDGFTYFSVKHLPSQTGGGLIHVTHPDSFSTVYEQPAALGTIDAFYVSASQDVLILADDPSGSGPVRLISNGMTVVTLPGVNRGIDLAAPAFHYPHAWEDVGGGSPGSLGVPVLKGLGVLAGGRPTSWK
ncbi:MAG: hypothetical protein ACYTG2_14775 [Planctomycetota bacterium]|jgi:hypothetical protein